MMTRATAAAAALATVVCLHSAAGFAIVAPTTTSKTALQMGLFDGVKEAFSAPALERSTLNSERETPIDRWMGWSVVREDQEAEQAAADKNFVDSMDPANYIAVELHKPMGIIFEENDEEFGGVFVQSLKEDGIAAQNGILQTGDQLVAVNEIKVGGKSFDDALNTIIETPNEGTTKLTLFRGTATQFYGPTGASQAWLDEFIAGGGVPPASSS